jgi:NAD(P)-dependent dehydrogenase (short-subunit alcohol dehydrogenase family)
MQMPTERQPVAIVTGAGGRIGRAIAAMLARDGYALILNDIDPYRCEGTAGQLSAAGATVMAMTSDVSLRADAEALVDMALAAWGQLDLLVNCAGIFPNAPVVDMNDEEWDRVFNVNLRGPFMLSRAAARAMISGGNGGNIINISSTAGESARIGAAHYCGSKAALNMLSRVLAIELAPHGIRVNVVAPGIVVDDVITSPTPAGTDPYLAALLSGIPLGRTGRGEDIAAAVQFLISPAAAWITGEILHVNGGSTAGRTTLPRS